MKQNNWLLLVGIAVLGTTVACGAAKTPTSEFKYSRTTSVAVPS